MPLLLQCQRALDSVRPGQHWGGWANVVQAHNTVGDVGFVLCCLFVVAAGRWSDLRGAEKNGEE